MIRDKKQFRRLPTGPLRSQNPAAIHLLETHLEKIDWDRLSRNSAALRLLEAQPDKINWEELSHNEAIFVSNKPELVATLLALELS